MCMGRIGLDLCTNLIMYYRLTGGGGGGGGKSRGKYLYVSYHGMLCMAVLSQLQMNALKTLTR